MFKQKQEKSYILQQKTNIVVAGINVYQNDKGQNILFDNHSKIGYLIQEKDKNSFHLYYNRYIIVILTFLVGIASFSIDWKLVLSFSIMFAIILEWRYRKAFLPSLVQIENFKPNKKITMVDALVEQNNKFNCILLAILYLAFGIVTLMNGIMAQRTTALICAIFILILSIYKSSVFIRAILKMK